MPSAEIRTRVGAKGRVFSRAFVSQSERSAVRLCHRSSCDDKCRHPSQTTWRLVCPSALGETAWEKLRHRGRTLPVSCPHLSSPEPSGNENCALPPPRIQQGGGPTPPAGSGRARTKTAVHFPGRSRAACGWREKGTSGRKQAAAPSDGPSWPGVTQEPSLPPPHGGGHFGSEAPSSCCPPGPYNPERVSLAKVSQGPWVRARPGRATAAPRRATHTHHWLLGAPRWPLNFSEPVSFLRRAAAASRSTRTRNPAPRVPPSGAKTALLVGWRGAGPESNARPLKPSASRADPVVFFPQNSQLPVSQIKGLGSPSVGVVLLVSSVWINQKQAEEMPCSLDTQHEHSGETC